MKLLLRTVCLLMVLALLPLQFGIAEETAAGAAALLSVTYVDNNKKKVDATTLTDGDDETALTFAKGDTAQMTVELSDGDQCQSVYIRLSVSCTEATLQELNTGYTQV